VTELAPLPAWVGGASRPSAEAAAGLPRGALAVNLHGRGPESHRLLLATAPQRLIAFACADVPESRDGPPWEAPAASAPAPARADAPAAAGPAPEHETARWCRLLRHHGIPADPGALEIAAPPAEPRLVRLSARARGATVIHAGAASAARRWPAERWSEVARAERRRGRAVLLTGSPGEAPLAQSIADAAGLAPDAVLAGRTDLLELTAVVAAAGRVVCGDTGVAHLATALATPSLVLFGPVSPALWGPPADRPRHRALWRGGEDAVGAVGDPHADRPDPGLLAITSEEAVEQLATLA
jgi:ADP-heptose:LPS heptosyltransferase